MKVLCSVVLAIACAGFVMADDTVSVATGGTWYSFPALGPQNSGPDGGGSGPFWDNTSSDGTNCNIGFVLTGTATGCANMVPQVGMAPGPLDYLGGSTQSQTAPSFYFTPTTGTSTAGTYFVSIAGYTTSSSTTGESFGYATYNPGTQAIGALNPLFTVSNGVVTVNQTSFTTNSDFVFYLNLNPCYPSGNCQPNPLTTSGNSSQFALFTEVPSSPSGPPTALSNFWLGMDDVINNGPGGHSDLDYQDVVAHITTSTSSSGGNGGGSTTPEPGFYGLLGLGLSGLGFAARRRQASSRN